jgi:hypothetical protein
MSVLINPFRSSIAVAAAVAILCSGCDGVGTGFSVSEHEREVSVEPPLMEPGGGVSLSKTDVDELADFVAAVRFDAVLPMSTRLHRMPTPVREKFLEKLRKAMEALEEAMAQLEDEGDHPDPKTVRALEKANSKITRLFKIILSDQEQRRLREKGQAIINKYPFLRGMTSQEIQKILQQAYGASNHGLVTVDPWLPKSAVVDTGEGDNCRTECGITAAIQFGATEIAFLGATFGCTVSSLGIVPCMGFALGLKFYQIGSLTWGLYTCVKRC